MPMNFTQIFNFFGKLYIENCTLSIDLPRYSPPYCNTSNTVYRVYKKKGDL
jgi:hypothetical protein